MITLFDNYGRIISWESAAIFIRRTLWVIPLLYCIWCLHDTEWPALHECPPWQRSRAVSITVFVPMFKDAWTNSRHHLHLCLLVFHSHCSSRLSQLRVALFIQSDTCHLGKPLLAKLLLDSSLHCKPFTMGLRPPPIFKQHFVTIVFWKTEFLAAQL